MRSFVLLGVGMITVDQIDLPSAVQTRLREQASFSENFSSFKREHIIGFSQPVAVAAAFVGPVLVSFVYLVSDFLTMLEVAAFFSVTTTAFLVGAWYTNRHRIRASFTRQTQARRQARQDLKLGRGDQIELRMRTPAAFYEHKNGVIALAKANPNQTLFFDIPASETDPRWFLYLNGDLHRNDWRWIRLSGSGGVVEFKARGQQLTSFGEDPFIAARASHRAVLEAFEAPKDGDVLDVSFEDARNIISRLL